jgi:murein DD-endopeptidase MepM/ murein hydrolase activator NlpD
VQSGDTLSAIAAANGVSVADITALNDIPNQSVIRVGQNLTVPATNCRAPSQAQSNSAGSTRTFEVYDCRNLGGNIFEWYSAEVEYDQAGNPSNVTRTAGPYSGAWQPGCPAPTQGGNSSSNNNGSSSSNSGGGGSSGGGSSTPPEESGGGGDEGGGGGGGLGGLICGLLPC